MSQSLIKHEGKNAQILHQALTEYLIADYEAATAVGDSDLLDSLDMGSCSLFLITEGTERMLVIQTSSGHAAKIPVTFFNLNA